MRRENLRFLVFAKADEDLDTPIRQIPDCAAVAAFVVATLVECHFARTARLFHVLSEEVVDLDNVLTEGILPLFAHRVESTGAGVLFAHQCVELLLKFGDLPFEALVLPYDCSKIKDNEKHL